MQPSKISFHQFMSYRQAVVSLPSNGLVLVTGKNGQGKTCILEGVAMAAWGKTLRGTPPWWEQLPGRPPGEPINGHVQLETHTGLTITRQREGGKNVLTWTQLHGTATQYPTATKAQEGLDPLVGSFEVWRRTCVFSTQDAYHFSEATDSERKRFLEELLGLVLFDDALRKCRADLRAAQAKGATASRDLAIMQERVRGETQRQKDAQTGLDALACQATPVDVELTKLKLADLRNLLNQCNDEERQLQSQQRQAAHGDGKREATVEQLRRQLANLQAGTCRLCGQPVSPEKRKRLQAQLDAELAALEKQHATSDDTRAVNTDRLAELAEERDELNSQIMTHTGHLQWAAKTANQRATHERVLAEATAALAKAQEGMQKAQDHLQAMQAEENELCAVEQVLGLQGVRVQVLAEALTGLETVANSWLARIAGPGLRLALRQYSETAKGSACDKLSLDITGAGGGYGYKGSSGGQRRRIDVALLFALAEVSQAALGQTGSALWFDEVFDSLDDEGVSAVAEALGELACERLVVVISHSDAVRSMLRANIHLHVDAGTVREVA